MTVARLVLSDGTIFKGRAVGRIGTTTGEAVFNTGMSGYQEVLTDPSYTGQLVTMTYPEIGNYGIVEADNESDGAKVAGFIMRRCCPFPSNFRSHIALGDWLDKQGIVGIEEVDTRAITKRLREVGAMPAILSSDESISDEELVEKAKAVPSMAGQDLASQVTTDKPYEWTEESSEEEFGQLVDWAKCDKHVVAIDCGIKHNILRLLKSCGFKLSVVPATTSAEDILALNPDGIFVSNGPGDPEPVITTAATVKTLIDSGKPMFGICLGHQLISLALGAKTFKLKFGHRGANHPIMNLGTKAVEIASHNHGFAVDKDSLPAGVELTHLNLNDQTCAGIACTDKPVFSVQYHPEACPGPSDPLYLFRQFTENVQKAG